MLLTCPVGSISGTVDVFHNCYHNNDNLDDWGTISFGLRSQKHRRRKFYTLVRWILCGWDAILLKYNYSFSGVLHIRQGFPGKSLLLFSKPDVSGYSPNHVSPLAVCNQQIILALMQQGRKVVPTVTVFPILMSYSRVICPCIIDR